MDTENYKMNLNSLIEAILDEGKLVTYVSISKDFCIHINTSKDLMNKAVEVIRNKTPITALNVTYLCSGLTHNNKACTYVCTENDLTEYRKKFQTLFFEHIYSVNKGNPSIDKVAVMAITKFEDYNLCSGLIKSNNCSKRTKDEISNLKTNGVVTSVDQTLNKVPQKPVKNEKTVNAATNGYGKQENVPEVKLESSTKQEKMSPNKELANSNKQKIEAKNAAKPQKGIAGFFSRSDSIPSMKLVNKTKNKEPEYMKPEEAHTNGKIKLEKMDIDEDAEGKSEGQNKTKPNNNKQGESKPADANKSQKESNNATKNKSKSTKSLTDIKKNAKVDKKRKRVLQISDSESDEEENDPFKDEDHSEEKVVTDSEDEIPPTPNANVIKVTSTSSNPRKRRKVITKTYKDEDGYILTKKEEVYEDVSDSEEVNDTKENTEISVKNNAEKFSKEEEKSKVTKIEISPKKKTTVAKKAKKQSPKQGKQATLMSFFKKA